MKLFILFSIIFTATFYVLDVFFVWENIHSHSVPHITIQSPPVPTPEQESNNEVLAELAAAKEQRVRDTIFQSLASKKIPKKIVFLYKPESFSEKTGWMYKKPILDILESNIFSEKVQNIIVMLYENKNSVRWNMKNKVLRIYDPERLWVNETVSVFLHELGHHIDLYHLSETDDYDMSHEFYAISWQTTKITKSWQLLTDFVSGYAASNAYEDFSESFLYFTLHNKDFLEKSAESTILQQKYDFFANVLYTDWTFRWSDFSQSETKSYYRDITKIDFSLENFLDYLKKSI
jgi:hypothetical protein